MKPIAPNTLIQNRYLVVHLIGKGGMGEVYLAVDQRLGSAVALKRTFFSDDEQLGNAFEREARTLARLRHPVLPKVSDHFTEQGTQYLVMEHISGEDISKRLESNKKPFPLSWVLFWADHLLDSLTYLHTHEPPIVHRDIKPQNLKLTDENNIVLLDFGLSKSSGGETRISTSGSIVGYTPHYAPMEQIRGTGTDGRSDIYALSATLYQILTNIVPADALTRADAIINGMPDPIKPLNEVNSEVSEAVSEVIIRGMGISQDKRFNTARDMQKALRDAYSRTKNDAPSQTASLNEVKAESQPHVVEELQPSQIVTEVVPIHSSVPTESVPVQMSSPVSQPIEAAASNKQNFDTHSVSLPVSAEPVQDFDATLRYDEDLHGSAPKQSDIQTEVFIAGSSPEITAAQNGYYDSDDSAKDDQNFKHSAAENFEQVDSTAFDDFEQFGDDNFTPGATIPLFTLDDQKVDAVSNNSMAGSSSAGAATYVPQQHLSSPTDYKDNKPVPPTTKQKSSGSGMAIAGGVGAFLILAIGAVAIGWYMFGGSDKKVVEDAPAVIPQATVEVSPTPAPTLETLIEDNSNANSSTAGLTDDENSNSENEKNPTSTKPDDLTVKNPGSQTNDPNPRKDRDTVSPPPVRDTTGRQSSQTAGVKSPANPPPPKSTPIPKKTPFKIDPTKVIP